MRFKRGLGRSPTRLAAAQLGQAQFRFWIRHVANNLPTGMQSEGSLTENADLFPGELDRMPLLAVWPYRHRSYVATTEEHLIMVIPYLFKRPFFVEHSLIAKVRLRPPGQAVLGSFALPDRPPLSRFFFWDNEPNMLLRFSERTQRPRRTFLSNNCRLIIPRKIRAIALSFDDPFEAAGRLLRCPESAIESG